jgi:two-component system, OmpR family, sensor histidine kinase KdpD
MSFSTKATYLEYHLSLAQRLAKARARSVESESRVASNLARPSGDEPTTSEGLRTELLPLLLSAAGVGLVTGLLLLLDRRLALTVVPLAYLVPVIIAATQWGIWPAMLASIGGMAAADFFFFPPVYSFQVEDPREVIDLLLFLVVALVASNLADRLWRETEMLRRREREIQQLYEFSQRLAACFSSSDLVRAIQNYLAGTLGPQAALFVAMADGRIERPQSGSVPSAVRDAVASMVDTAKDAARSIIDQATQDVWLLRAVSSESAVHGVVAINVGHGSREAIDSKMRRVEAILEEVSLTLQRLDIGKAMEDARLHLQAEMLRDAFHGTISHELCSPLAAIRGSASVLEEVPQVKDDARVRALVEAISEETAQLDGFIQNLLNATRVTAGGITPRLEWADPKDLLNEAIRQRTRRLSAHQVDTEFAEELPLVHVDSGLIEEACGQLLENAAKYSPSGSTVLAKARAEPGRVVLSISDQGVGITAEEQQQLGLRSFRSARHQTTTPGSGLGFWIASTFVKANGGTIAVSSPGQGQGTTVSISLPASPMTPSELTELANE